jgi:hypothetical protein
MFTRLVDEFYSASLTQDTFRGLQENASCGLFSGGTPPLGCRPKVKSDGKKVLEIDPYYGRIVDQMFRWRSMD